jgi:hypothetical protein
MVEKDVKLDGVLVFYDYPASPPYGLKMGVGYRAKQEKTKFFITDGNAEIELKEIEIRTFFSEKK